MNDATFDKEASAVLAEYNRAIVGLQGAWPAGQTSIILQQVTYTPTTLIAKLQQESAPIQAVVDARSVLNSAMANRRAAMPAAVAFLTGFFAALPQYLAPGADVTKFGSRPKKARAPLTADQKVAANQKRAATRAARHIMGPKQRSAIHAPPPSSPSAPAAATSPSAPSAPTPLATPATK